MKVTATLWRWVLPGLLWPMTACSQSGALSLEPLFEERFSRPVALVQAPHASPYWYVVEQGGRILCLEGEGQHGSLLYQRCSLRGFLEIGQCHRGLTGLELAHQGIVLVQVQGPEPGAAFSPEAVLPGRLKDAGLFIFQEQIMVLFLSIYLLFHEAYFKFKLLRFHSQKKGISNKNTANHTHYKNEKHRAYLEEK